MTTSGREHSRTSEKAQHDTGTGHTLGPAFYSAIGKKGGETMRKKIGPRGFQEMGMKGGAATKRKYGSDYYSRIGKLGGKSKHKNRSQPEA